MDKQDLNLPDEAKAKDAFWDLCKTIASLRHPKTGCPWDLRQSHESLQKYLVEEAYETVDVMTNNASLELADELGDVLLQVLLNAQLACDRGAFTIIDIMKIINKKMIHRHPHVFEEGFEYKDEAQIKANWQKLKSQEKDLDATAEARRLGKSQSFYKAYGKGPANYQALKIGQISQKIDFDWDKPEEVLAQLRAEICELEDEINVKGEPSRARLADEVGDVYFTLVQLARHLKVDPERAALDANKKFLMRFNKVEELALEKGLGAIESIGTEGLNKLWDQAKKELK